MLMTSLTPFVGAHRFGGGATVFTIDSRVGGAIEARLGVETAAGFGADVTAQLVIIEKSAHQVAT